MDVTKPCNTVGAHLAKVSLNSADPVLYTEGRYRRFTLREVACIQSFPENFSLFGSESAQYRALGNVIPPLMFWYVANKIDIGMFRRRHMIKNVSLLYNYATVFL